MPNMFYISSFCCISEDDEYPLGFYAEGAALLTKRNLNFVSYVILFVTYSEVKSGQSIKWSMKASLLCRLYEIVLTHEWGSCYRSLGEQPC